VKELLNHIYDFLVTHDFPTLLESSRKLEWSQVARSPYTWLVALPILIYLIWTKKFKILTAIASCILFVLLIQSTISTGEDTLSLHNLFVFLGGAMGLIGINIYLIFVRQ